jgi:Tfp pilus assembly protein PilZ
MVDYARRYERIEVDIRCRLFVLEEGKNNELRFEAFASSQNMGLGGVFLQSDLLLKKNVELFLELFLPDQQLTIQGRVAHLISHDTPDFPTGMGIEFLNVDSRAREVLLRYFSPMRYLSFYEGMTSEFPHLAKTYQIQDACLILNLWEEWKVLQEGGPASTASGVPEALPIKKGKK